MRIAILLLLSFPPCCSAQGGHSATPAELYEHAHSSIVVIVTSDKNDNPLSQGSGFIVARGKVVTNHHVLEGASSAVVVFADGLSSKAEGVIADSATADLTILSVKTESRSALQIGNELDVHQGDPVYAIGAPRGLELSITNGIVSGFRRLDDQFLIQTTAPIAPGSSGGPLFDGEGKVIGVTTLYLSDSPGIYFSIGAGDVTRLLRAPSLKIVSLSDHFENRPETSAPATSARGQTPQTDTKKIKQPDITGTYYGTVHNSSVSVTAAFSIAIQREGETVQGCMIVRPPLYGSGPLRGSIDRDSIRFNVTSPLFHIRFDGTTEDTGISGTYVVTWPQLQNGHFELERTSADAPGAASDPQKCFVDAKPN